MTRCRLPVGRGERSGAQAPARCALSGATPAREQGAPEAGVAAATAGVRAPRGPQTLAEPGAGAAGPWRLLPKLDVRHSWRRTGASTCPCRGRRGELQGAPAAAAHPGGPCPAAAPAPRRAPAGPRAPVPLQGPRGSRKARGQHRERVPVRRWRSPAVLGPGAGRAFPELARGARSPPGVWSSATRVLLGCREQVPACGDQRAALYSSCVFISGWCATGAERVWEYRPYLGLVPGVVF